MQIAADEIVMYPVVPVHCVHLFIHLHATKSKTTYHIEAHRNKYLYLNNVLSVMAKLSYSPTMLEADPGRMIAAAQFLNQSSLW